MVIVIGTIKISLKLNIRESKRHTCMNFRVMTLVQN